MADGLSRSSCGSVEKDFGAVMAISNGPKVTHSQLLWFVPAVVLTLVFAMAARTPLDSDMWWHLRAGEETWRTGQVVTTDLFSHTRHGESWINHSWLSQVVMFLLFHNMGYFGLGSLVAILATASMGLVYLQMDGHPLLRAFVLAFASAVAALVWSPRPQLVSLVLFAALGFILYLYKWQQRDHLWAFVPIFILWSNFHGGYVLGFLLVGSLVAGELLNHLLGYRGRERIPGKGIIRLIMWGVAAGLVVVINPNGPAMWAIPFRTVGVGVLREFISEWTSPDFHQFVQQPFLWLLLVTFGLAGISSRRLDGSDLVAISLFAYLAFLARRNYGPFALVAAPILSRHLDCVLQSWWSRNKTKLPQFFSIFAISIDLAAKPLSQKVLLLVNVSILLFLALVTILKLLIVTSPGLVATFKEDSHPVQAVRWIKENQPSGNMFNSYNWGGYLVWELRDYPVFVDGRTDLYDDELLRQYLQAISAEPGWELIFDRFGVNLVLVEINSGLARELARSQSWQVGYQDDQAVVFLRNPFLPTRLLPPDFAPSWPSGYFNVQIQRSRCL